MGDIKLNTTSGSITLSAEDGAGATTATIPKEASELVVKNSSGNVGIGTSSPSAKLDVGGALLAPAEVRITNVGGSWAADDEIGRYSFYTTDGSGIGARELTSIRGVSENSGTTASGTLAFYTSPYNSGVTEAMRIDSSGNLKFDSGYGSVATAYGCRAWCSFNGSGTISITGSGNVSSLTDNGNGNYQVNFSTSIADTNYSGQATAGGPSSGNSFTYHATVHSRATGSCGINTSAYNGGVTLLDSDHVHLAVFREEKL